MNLRLPKASTLRSRLNLGILINKKIHYAISIKIWRDRILLTQQLILCRHSTQHQQALQSIVRSEQNICIQPIAHHANLPPFQSQLIAQVVNHKRTGLPHHRRLLPRASLNRTDHAPIPRPFLRIRQMRHGIRIGSNKLASGILIDAKLRILNFVVVDMPIKSHHDGANIRIVIDLTSRSHIGDLPTVLGSTKVRHANEVQFLLDSHLSDDVHFFTTLLEFGLFEVGRGGEGGGKDFLGGHVEAEGIEFLLVARA
mmetsp:Transcript_6169/g.11269  ORF Transcript_6169/g.11269 Transcript_6169/m.11269 type:complete len:255 (+) Transcript_6169:140-904(+)